MSLCRTGPRDTAAADSFAATAGSFRCWVDHSSVAVPRQLAFWRATQAQRRRSRQRIQIDRTRTCIGATRGRAARSACPAKSGGLPWVDEGQPVPLLCSL